jgi:hypothetical protein
LKKTYSGFDKNEAEFRVLVLAIPLEMFPDGHGLLDQHVEILGDFWCQSCVEKSLRQP